ncbi:MAG TPA: archemetzincin [bacterium (Candidatus Stahlbacteria)]|nr:archemetzincin [Candidatus Stahlbacteria bacterium]
MRRTELLNPITLIPIGKLLLPEAELSNIKKKVSKVLKREVRIGKGIPLPIEAFDSLRNQWRATRIVQSLPDLNGLIIGIVDQDLYAPNLNFVFGEAHPHQGKAVVSTARLAPVPQHLEEEGLFRQRIIKEPIHEIGHLLGLPHCPDKKCVMYFSNSISDTDRKGTDFCRECLRNLSQ